MNHADSNSEVDSSNRECSTDSDRDGGTAHMPEIQREEGGSPSLSGSAENNRQGIILNIPVMDVYAEVDYLTNKLSF